MIKISILCENQVGHSGAKTCRGEWGLSILAQYNGYSVLLDTGHTNIYWENAMAMDIDLQDVDCIALSHAHWDHAGGLKYHQFDDRKKIVFHPDLPDKLLEKDKQRFNSDFELIPAKSSLEMLPGFWFLGEIPRVTSFEKGTYKGVSMWDDSAIAISTDKGVVVISGCSHSGICNICEQAKKVTKQKLYAVIGGFHLTENDSVAVEGTLDYFKRENPDYLYPMHCVDFPTLAKFHAEFGSPKLSAGDIIAL